MSSGYGLWAMGYQLTTFRGELFVIGDWSLVDVRCSLFVIGDWSLVVGR